MVACREHGSHEVDVVGLARESVPRTRAARITVLGEAKATIRPCGVADLQRLMHVRELLVADRWQAADAELVLFSQHGFAPELWAGEAGRPVRLVDLPDLYGIN